MLFLLLIANLDFYIEKKTFLVEFQFLRFPILLALVDTSEELCRYVQAKFFRCMLQI